MIAPASEILHHSKLQSQIIEQIILRVVEIFGVTESTKGGVFGYEK